MRACAALPASTPIRVRIQTLPPPCSWKCSSCVSVCKDAGGAGSAGKEHDCPAVNQLTASSQAYKSCLVGTSGLLPSRSRVLAPLVARVVHVRLMGQAVAAQAACAGNSAWHPSQLLMWPRSPGLTPTPARRMPRPVVGRQAATDVHVAGMRGRRRRGRPPPRQTRC